MRAPTWLARLRAGALAFAFPLAFSLALSLAAVAGVAGGARAQEAQPSLVELKAAAYDAQQAAAQAEAAAAAAKAQADEARTKLEQANATPAPAPVSAPPPAAPAAPASSSVIAQPGPPIAPAATPPPVVVIQTAPAPQPQTAAEPAAPPAADEKPVSREELDRAMEKAEQAAAQARRAIEELEAYKEQQRKRYARNGFYMSGGAFWAPQFFDTTAHVEESKGLSGGLGYRVHPHFSVDASFVWVQGFDVETTVLSQDGLSLLDYQADVAMWSALLGGRVFFLTGKVQPYVGVGFGASGGKGTFRSDGGPDIEWKEFGGTISFNGGLEVYLSESLAIAGDAAVYLPGGDLRGLDYSTIGGKLVYRF